MRIEKLPPSVFEQSEEGYKRFLLKNIENDI
jgi:hypothetical protein